MLGMLHWNDHHTHDYMLTNGYQARGIRNKDIPTKARLTYFQDQNLVLQLQYKKEDDWIPCFDIPNIKIPTVSYLGFSAETGELSDNHDIISVQTKNLYDATTRGQSRKAAEQKRKDRVASKKPSPAYSEGSSSGIGGWLWFFTKVIIGSGVVGGAGYVGYTAYRTRQRKNARAYNPF
jgi:mannose-binding lectin 2